MGKRIDEIFLVSLLASLGEDEVVLLLQKYQADYRKRTRALLNHILEGEEEEAKKIIHTLRGVSSQFGFSLVSSKLAKIKENIPSGDEDISGLEVEIEASIVDAAIMIKAFRRS